MSNEQNGGLIMGLLALILGALGGLCGVTGIFTAVGVAPSFIAEPSWATWMFWFVLAGVLLIACIAALIARSEY